MTVEEIMALDYRAAEAEAAAFKRRAAKQEFWFDLVRGLLLAVVQMAFFGAVTLLAIAARERAEAERNAAEAHALLSISTGGRYALADALRDARPVRRGERSCARGAGDRRRADDFPKLALRGQDKARSASFRD